jgi:putative ABC transport system ATP-binding protein
VFRATLVAEGLEDDLVAMGEQIASTMLEIFRGLPPGHPLFEQFSFLSADELPEYEAVLARRTVGTVRTPRAQDGEGDGEIQRTRTSPWRRALSRFAAKRLGLGRLGVAGRYGPADRTRLVALPLAYIEPRHRLGLLDASLEERLVNARAALREALDAAGEDGVAYYDPDAVCTAAPLRDNLLFGRADQSVADAATRVTAAITAVIEEMDLSDAIARVGLDHQVGPAGRLLTSAQRAGVSLARALVRRPDWLVLDGALTPLGETRAREVLDLLLARFKEQGRTLVMVLPSARITGDFGVRIAATGTHLAIADAPAPAAATEAVTKAPPSEPDAAPPTEDPPSGAAPEDDPDRPDEAPTAPRPAHPRRVPEEASR